MRVLRVRNWSFWLYFLLVLPSITFVALGRSLNSPFSSSDLDVFKQPLAYSPLGSGVLVGCMRLPCSDIPILQLLRPYLGLDPRPYFAISLLLRMISAASFYPLTKLLTGSNPFAILSTTLFAVGNPGIQSSQSFALSMETFIAITLANLAFYASLKSKMVPGGRMELLTLVLLASAVLVNPRRMSLLLLIFPLLNLFWAFRMRKGLDSVTVLRRLLPTFGLCLILAYLIIARSWWFPSTSGIKVTQSKILEILASVGYTIIPFDAIYIPFSAFFAQGTLQRIVIAYELLAVILLVIVTLIAIFRSERSTWITIGLGIISAMIAGRAFQWHTPLDLYALLVGIVGLVLLLKVCVDGVRKNSNEADLQLFVLLWSVATLALSWLTADARREITSLYTEHRYLLVTFAGFTIVIARALAQYASNSPRSRKISLVVMLIIIAVNMVADHHFFQRIERLRATHPEYQA